MTEQPFLSRLRAGELTLLMGIRSARTPDAVRIARATGWPHLPDGQRDTGEVLNLLADWVPDPGDRETILVDGPDRLFFSD